MLLLVIVGGALAYVFTLKKEVVHYKSSSIKWEQTYNEYKSNSEAMQAALKSSNASLTLQVKQGLIMVFKADEATHQAITQRIINDKAAKAIFIPDASVRVFNDSATASTGQSAAAVSGDAGGPDTPTADNAYTLQDVESAVADNDTAAWKCIHQIEVWKTFWAKFVANVTAAKAISAQPG